MEIKRFQSGSRMSQAVVGVPSVHIAGQVADDCTASIEIQTQQVLEKIENLLKQVGSSKSKLLSINIFLPHIMDFEAMNSVYDKWIDSVNPPVRACVEARLADPNLRVEMTAVASI